MRERGLAVGRPEKDREGELCPSGPTVTDGTPEMPAPAATRTRERKAAAGKHQILWGQAAMATSIRGEIHRLHEQKLRRLTCSHNCAPHTFWYSPTASSSAARAPGRSYSQVFRGVSSPQLFALNAAILHTLKKMAIGPEQGPAIGPGYCFHPLPGAG